MAEIVIVKLCSHRNCIPGRCCVLPQFIAVPLSRQKMAELLSCVTPFLPVLSCVNPFHCFLSHSLLLTTLWTPFFFSRSSWTSQITCHQTMPFIAISLSLIWFLKSSMMWFGFAGCFCCLGFFWEGGEVGWWWFWLKLMFPLTAFFLPGKSIVLSALFLSLLPDSSISAPPGLESSSESSAIFSFASCSPVWEKHFYPTMGNFPTHSFSLFCMLFCYYYLYKPIFTCHCLPLI